MTAALGDVGRLVRCLFPAGLFIDLNDGRWDPDPPDVDDAEQAMLALAVGEIDERAL